MLLNNSVLSALKKKLKQPAPVVEGIVKGSTKTFGFLEIDGGVRYFIAPPYMRKLMHGDRVKGSLEDDLGSKEDRKQFVPNQLVEPGLKRFVGQLIGTTSGWAILPDHPFAKHPLPCRISSSGLEKKSLREGDWVVAILGQHPLVGSSGGYATATEYVARGIDPFARWWVALARQKLARRMPMTFEPLNLDTSISRVDATEACFFTIDSAETKDMDDAIAILPGADEGSYRLSVAIADPTSYIEAGSFLDQLAAEQAFTSYLPGLNLPMLPRFLAEDLCALVPYQQRSALVCDVTVNADGSLKDDAQFKLAWIKSKARLTYEQVSDWLEDGFATNPPDDMLVIALKQLSDAMQRRQLWRARHAVMFKFRPEFRFIIDRTGQVADIKVVPRRLAHALVEEAMIAANICAAKALTDKLGCGIFNVHSGFDARQIKEVCRILSEAGDKYLDPAILLTREGFRRVKPHLEGEYSPLLAAKLRRFQMSAEFSATPKAHFGMGLAAYATWTSPIRKYGDLINHRLLKALVYGQSSGVQIDDQLLLRIAERRRQHRLAEREVIEWLYARFLGQPLQSKKLFKAEIVEVTKGGLRIQLIENGALAFVPLSRLDGSREEMVCLPEEGVVKLRGIINYQIGDQLTVRIESAHPETRSIIAAPAA